MKTLIDGGTNTPGPTVVPKVVCFPFLGAIRRVSEKGILVWRTSVARCLPTVGIMEWCIWNGVKSLNIQHVSLQQEKKNSSNTSFPNSRPYSEASPISLSPQNNLAA